MSTQGFLRTNCSVGALSADCKGIRLRKILSNELIELTLVSAEADTPLKPMKVNLFTIILYHSENSIREGHSVVHCFVTGHSNVSRRL